MCCVIIQYGCFKVRDKLTGRNCIPDFLKTVLGFPGLFPVSRHEVFLDKICGVILYKVDLYIYFCQRDDDACFGEGNLNSQFFLSNVMPPLTQRYKQLYPWWTAQCWIQNCTKNEHCMLKVCQPDLTLSDNRCWQYNCQYGTNHRLPSLTQLIKKHKSCDKFSDTYFISVYVNLGPQTR